MGTRRSLGYESRPQVLMNILRFILLLCSGLLLPCKGADESEKVHLPDRKAQNLGAECWEPCGGKEGSCPDFCGKNGMCCREGWKNKGCDGTLGVPDQHRCVEQPGNDESNGALQSGPLQTTEQANNETGNDGRNDTIKKETAITPVSLAVRDTAGNDQGTESDGSKSNTGSKQSLFEMLESLETILTDDGNDEVNYASNKEPDFMPVYDAVGDTAGNDEGKKASNKEKAVTPVYDAVRDTIGWPSLADAVRDTAGNGQVTEL